MRARDVGARGWGAQDERVVDVDIDHLGFAGAYKSIVALFPSLSGVDTRNGGVDGARSIRGDKVPYKKRMTVRL